MARGLRRYWSALLIQLVLVLAVGAQAAEAPGPAPFQGRFPTHWSRLARGVNITTDQFWNMKRADFRYLKSIGIQNVRVGLSPYGSHQLKAGERFDPIAPYAQQLKSLLDMAIREDLAVITSWCGDFPLDTTKATADLYTENWRLFTYWIGFNYKPTDVFLEMRNEPFMQHPKDWWAIEDQAIKAIHAVGPGFTVVAEANGFDASLPQPWTQNGSLIPLHAHSDKNVVYNIHFYEPMTFTHQGAAWVSFAKDLRNVGYPSGGVDQSYIEKQFDELAEWAKKYGTYITINEFGAINNAPRADALNYLADVAMALQHHGFGWDVFNLNSNFMFSARVDGRTVVPDDIQQALGLGAYLDVPRRPVAAEAPSASGGVLPE
jgi:endoglucanase